MKLKDMDIPENPGPVLLGREPLVGAFRRSVGAPVLRDMVRKATPTARNMASTESTEPSTQSRSGSGESSTDTVGRDVPEIDF